MRTRKPNPLSKSEARELRRIATRTVRDGGASLDVVRKEMLADMAAELRRMAKAYVRTHKGGAELLDALGLAKMEGVDPAVMAEIMGLIGVNARRRKAA